MVVVFGSINLDAVFTVDRLPGAGETVTGAGYADFPGGKGANQAVAAARAGAAVTMVGAVGDDALAEAPLSALRDAGVDASRVQRTAYPTGYASIWVDRTGENRIIVASGANAHLGAEALPDELLGPATTLVLQLEVPLEANLAVIERARGSRVILNAAPFTGIPAGTLSALLAGVDVLIVNESEARALFAALGDGDAPQAPVPAAIAQRYGLAVVLTLGARGACAATASEGWQVGSLAIEAIDTTGAGDTFVGALAAALDRGERLPAALGIAVAAGALACTRRGAQSGMPSRSEIERSLAGLPEARPWRPE